MIPRIAVVGGGKFGLMHLRAFTQLQSEGKAELVGLADINPDTLEARRGEFGVHTYSSHIEMIEQQRPHAITVATPDFLHRQIALDGLARGCHVLVEKPLDTTVAGCREIEAAAQARGLLLQVDFHKRYDAYHKEMERAVREGKIGHVLYGYAWMEDRVEVPRDWFPGWAPKSSPCWFLGVHMFDLIYWTIKSKPTRVFAVGRKDKLKALGVDTYDSVCTTVAFDNGSTFTVHASWILPDNFEAMVNQGIRVVGTEGVIEIDSQDRGGRLCTTADGMMTYNLGFFTESNDKKGRTVFGGYGIESIQDFAFNVAHLLEGGKLGDIEGTYANAADGMVSTAIAAAAHQSADSGEAIAIAR